MKFILNEQEKRKKPFTKKDAGNVEYNNSVFNNSTMCESDGSDNYKAIHYIRVEDISEQIADEIDFSGTVGIDHFEGLVSDEDLEKIEIFLDGCDAQIYYNHKSNTYLIKDTSADFGPYTLPELLEDITYTLSQWNEIDSEE